MFLLKQVFRLREKSMENQAEQGFLDHLEDLRKTITKIVVTLLLSTLLCFSFADEIMHFLRLPVEAVWSEYEKQHLPKDISAADWQQARSCNAVLTQLPAWQKGLYEQNLSEEMRKLMLAQVSYDAWASLPSSGQKEFLDALLKRNFDLHQTVKQLIDSKAIGQQNALKSSLSYMESFHPSEAFMLSMKMAFFAGLVISFPLLVYFILQFVLPGLLPNERKMLFPALGIGFGLFLCGSCFAYFVVLPKVLAFFFSYGLELGIVGEWRIGYYLGFVSQFVLLFGVAFELPVVVMVLVKIGLLDYQLMAKTRHYAVVAIMFLAAILTPTPDIPTMLLMAVPMYLLYEICVLLAWRDMRKQRKSAQNEPLGA